MPVVLLYALSADGIFRNIESWFSTPLGRAFEKGERFGQQVLNSEFARLEESANALSSALSARTSLPYWIEDFRLLHQLENVQLFDGNGVLLSGLLEKNNDDGGLSSNVMTHLRDEGIHRDINEDSIEIVVLLPFGREAYAMKISRALPIGISDGLQEVKRGRREYDKLKTARRGLRLSFMATLTMAFVMVLLAIIWGSLSLGQRLTRPLTRLIEIASEVGRGNFSRRLKNTFGNDEISRLNCSFNKMVEDLDLSHRQAGERQEAISKANTYLENLLASLSSGVLAFDSEGRLLRFNESAVGLLGNELHALTDKLPAQWPESSGVIARLAGVVWQALAEKTLVECRMPAGEGKTLIARARYLTPTADVRVLAVVDDITRQMQVEREAAWEEVSRRFAHEIKNPLTPIQLAAEHLQRKLSGKLASDEKKILERLVTTITNQVDAMRQMVDTFRFSADGRPVGAEAVDFIALVREVAHLYERPRLNLELSLIDDGKSVEGNAVVLRQVLHNLIGNADEAVADVESPLIKISAAVHGDGVLLSIKDNGVGLSKDIIGRAFEPYVTGKPSGTGLGLVVARRAVEDHGGRISLQNHTDGAIAEVWLPYRD